MSGLSEPPWPFLRHADLASFQAMAEEAIAAGDNAEWPHMILKMLVRIRQLEGACRSTQMPREGTPPPPPWS